MRTIASQFMKMVHGEWIAIKTRIARTQTIPTGSEVILLYEEFISVDILITIIENTFFHQNVSRETFCFSQKNQFH